MSNEVHETLQRRSDKALDLFGIINRLRNEIIEREQKIKAIEAKIQQIDRGLEDHNLKAEARFCDDCFHAESEHLPEKIRECKHSGCDCFGFNDGSDAVLRNSLLHMVKQAKNQDRTAALAIIATWLISHASDQLLDKLTSFIEQEGQEANEHRLAS